MEQLKQLEEIERRKAYLKQYQKSISREKRILDEIQRLRSEKIFLVVMEESSSRDMELADVNE